MNADRTLRRWGGAAPACWIAVWVLGLVQALGCASSRPPGAGPGVAPLVVASDLANPPFAWVDDAGVARGRDVEMMEALAEVLGRPLVWDRRPFDELLPAVERGAVDAVCATLGITAERAQRVAFTRPYYETEIAVVVRVAKGEPGSLEELTGRRVAAGAATTSQRAVRAYLPRAVGVFDAGKGGSTAERLQSGEIDAAAMDGPAADALVAASGGSLRRLPTALDAERYAIAVPLFRTELRADLDRVLGRLDARGWLDTLDQQYGL